MPYPEGLRQWRFKVTGEEAVTVPAGTFQALRVERIRESDAAVIDTLDGYFTSFAEQMEQSYGEFRRTSYDEIEKEDTRPVNHNKNVTQRPVADPISENQVKEEK